MAYNFKLFSLSDRHKGLSSSFYRYNGVRMSSKFFDSMLHTRYNIDSVTPTFSKEVVMEAVQCLPLRPWLGQVCVEIPSECWVQPSLYLFDIRFSDLKGANESTNGTNQKHKTLTKSNYFLQPKSNILAKLWYNIFQEPKKNFSDKENSSMTASKVQCKWK